MRLDDAKVDDPNPGATLGDFVAPGLLSLMTV